MIEVWLLESGDYSDYGVDAVYSTEELAEQAMKQLNRNRPYADYRISVRSLDVLPDIPEGMHRFRVQMSRNGEGSAWVRSTAGGNRDVVSRGLTVNPYSGDLIGDVFALHEQHALKIANEKRVQLLANNQWGSND